ncbi:MAG: HlyC/CorC family transporter [Eubacterium sp.]|nr:HlyC/CorC family transporter [Eubacterium sp.]MBR4241056.1 HlyC/CorC family transporter [Eubacterium sp.]
MGSGSLRRLFKRESSTEEEIKQLVDEDEGELEKSQREMINNIFEFDDITAGDIMTHRTDIVAAPDDGSLYDVVNLAIEEGVSRVPVFHEDLDDILGIIYVKDLLKFIGKEISKDEKLSDYIRKPLYVPESIACGKLFAKMTETRIQLAIVVDEYGGTAGLVTLEDILEELVGDIEDEYDEEEESIKKIDDKTYIFEGITDIEDAEEVLQIKFPEGDWDTLAGFVISKLGFLPTKEDENLTVEYENIVFTVLELDERRIEKIKAEIND